MKNSHPWRELTVALALLGGVLWLRWPTFGFSLWNLDEAIHATAARTLLDGGVLYRDAIDQRTPLSYYAVAALFAGFGENNLWAVRAGIAALIAATAFLLYLAGRRLRDTATGLAAAVLYALLSLAVLYPGDANAANTEWFVAFFSSAALAVFLGGGPARGRLFATGLLLGAGFLSKQPALLDLIAPLAALLYAGWRQAWSGRTILSRLSVVAVGWATPVLLTLGYFAAVGALRDGIFYTWTYNLAYYGPEVTTTDRLISLAVPFRLLGVAQPGLLALWVMGALAAVHRLLQRQPGTTEITTNPGLVLVAAWSLTGLAGAASGGRGFDHYSIQFLAPFCLGAGLVLSRLAGWSLAAPRRLGRIAAAVMLAAVAYDAIATTRAARGRTVPLDSSLRVANYIREHSAPTDRIFVWGYHPDIYFYADRRPASRYLYASFVTGLIPWTNTAPTRDTSYAIVPGAMETLLQDLAAQPPRFIVDCSAGPNRHWQKYPPEIYPALQYYLRRHYQQVEAQVFVPQGFRLYQLRTAAEPPGELSAPAPLPPAVLAKLKLGVLASPLTPLRATAPHGASQSVVDGRLEYFAHAPSAIVYQVLAGAAALRGGYGIRPGAYAPENRGPTDGAEFIIRWRPAGGGEQVLLRRLLRPREDPADRSVQAFRVELPAHQGGELELAIGTGPSDLAASDWTFWTDLLLETSP